MPKKIKKIDTPNLKQMMTPALLGQAILARRTQSNLRLEDAANLCGVAKQTYMKIEHGLQTVEFGSVLQVCSALGIKLFIASWPDNDEKNDDWK